MSSASSTDQNYQQSKNNGNRSEMVKQNERNTSEGSGSGNGSGRRNNSKRRNRGGSGGRKTVNDSNTIDKKKDGKNVNENTSVATSNQSSADGKGARRRGGRSRGGRNRNQNRSSRGRHRRNNDEAENEWSGSGERLKLIIRKLPPNLSEDDFSKLMRDAFNLPAGKDYLQSSGNNNDSVSSIQSAEDEIGDETMSPQCRHSNDSEESNAITTSSGCNSISNIMNPILWSSFRKGKVSAHRLVYSRAYLAVASTEHVMIVYKEFNEKRFVNEKGEQGFFN